MMSIVGPRFLRREVDHLQKKTYGKYEARKLDEIPLLLSNDMVDLAGKPLNPKHKEIVISSHWLGFRSRRRVRFSVRHESQVEEEAYEEAEEEAPKDETEIQVVR
ncbi:hypothetical protein Fmac_030990 [Flemingia macrophylla]|uniref:Uncharacterized protein n=1 Tax=Flemingia macrophylla TaxID=520843 RepID=A0ABD1L0S3_9FABA